MEIDKRKIAMPLSVVVALVMSGCHSDSNEITSSKNQRGQVIMITLIKLCYTSFGRWRKKRQYIIIIT